MSMSMPGRPSTSTADDNIEAVKKILHNRRIIIRGFVNDGISFGQAIFTDVLDIKRAAAKIVPKLLHF